MPLKKNIIDTTLAATDSVASDSVTPQFPAKGVQLLNPHIETPATTPGMADSGVSWILLAMLVIFSVIGIRFHNNRRYLKAFWRDLTETRIRSNVFDDTVRESLLMTLLNIEWILSAGVILTFSVARLQHNTIDIHSTGFLTDWGISTLICAGYEIIMLGIYTLTGNVFSDTHRTHMWVKGFTASQGLCGIMFFIISLLLICYPGSMGILLLISIVLFVIAKMIFLWKGFQIFFTQITSWMFFLYYLCSVEIIPVILMIYAANSLI